MTMTVEEIDDHILLLQSRLDRERKKVEDRVYTGPRTANLELIDALQGRIDELRISTEKIRVQMAAAVLVTA